MSQTTSVVACMDKLCHGCTDPCTTCVRFVYDTPCLEVAESVLNKSIVSKAVYLMQFLRLEMQISSIPQDDFCWTEGQ